MRAPLHAASTDLAYWPELSAYSDAVVFILTAIVMLAFGFAIGAGLAGLWEGL